MFRKMLALAAALALITSALAVDGDQPKYTIKDVMKHVHGKNGLLAKIKTGKSTDKDRAELLDYYESMPLNKPPKGDEASYRKLAVAMVDAAKSLKKGERDAMAKLNRATNCMSCHNSHKP
jgi:cytochrome c553